MELFSGVVYSRNSSSAPLSIGSLPYLSHSFQ